MNIVIITGASSGIGREFARKMDAYFSNIDEFWLVARRREPMEELSSVLKHKSRIFSMDITNDAKQERLEAMVREKRAVVRMLINCAGYGLMGSFSEQDREEMLGMLRLNCEALTNLTHRMIPYMKKGSRIIQLASSAAFLPQPDFAEEMLGMLRLNCEALTNLTHRMIPYMKKGSRIIQLASSAAFLPQPDFAVYAATKSYVLSFSRALGKELKDRGIYVTSVCPGPVRTAFFDIAEKTGTTLFIKKYTYVSPERVVALALKDSYRRRSMSVCSLPIRAFRMLAKTVPHGLILDILMLLKKKGLY